MIRVRIGLTHDHENFAERIEGVGGEPLAAVDHVLIAVAVDAGLDIGRVGGSDVGFSHAKGRADLALVAYGANEEETSRLVRRLGEVAGRDHDAQDPPEPFAISGGVVSLTLPLLSGPDSHSRGSEPGPSAMSNRIASLSRFAAAQSTLRKARDAGGGVRITELA